MSRIIVKKAKKQYVEDLDREVTVSKFQRLFVENSEDVQTTYGKITKGQLKAKDGELLKTDTGKEFYVYSPRFIDLYKRIERLPQIIPLKDIGRIISECGLGRDSVVIDTGTGSGAVACFLANIVKHVYSYEIKKEHYDVAVKNAETLGLTNIDFKNKDACAGFDEKDVDCVVLDLPEPWAALESVKVALRVGGFLVCYSPTIPQVMDFVTAVEKESCFLIEKTIEIVEREWQIEARKVRPKSKSSIHSGFLVFVRKIGL